MQSRHFWIVSSACWLALNTLFGSNSQPAVGQEGPTFDVQQAQAEWMPGRSNLRFYNERLESLFFVTVHSKKEMRGLVLQVTTGKHKTSVPLENITPLKDEFIRNELEKKPIWAVPTAHNPRANELKKHQALSCKIVQECWLPVLPGQPLTFSLFHNRKCLADLQKSIHFNAPVWWQLAARPATRLDPLDYGYAFLSKRKHLVAQGDLFHVSLAIVGLTSGSYPVNVHLTVGNRQATHKIAVSHLEQSNWQHSMTTTDLAPGKYLLDIELSNAANGKLIGQQQQEVLVVKSRPIRYRFGATYTDLKYDGPVVVDQRDSLGEKVLAEGQFAWDEITPHYGPHQDIVVSFDNKPDKLVFWRGASYVPMWVSQDVWSCWEWAETTGGRQNNYRGPVEPLMDRELRFGRVRILASHPARTIVHWRYPQSTRVYTIVDEEWVDEYYYIYPDMVAVRKVMGWFLEGSWHEINEFITVMPPGMHPRQVFQLPNSFSVTDLAGNRLDLHYPHPWKDWETRWSKLQQNNNDFVFRTHLQDRPTPFVGVKDLWRLYSTLWEGPYRALHAEATEGYQQASPDISIEQFIGAYEAPWMACWSWPVQRVPAIGTVVCRPWQYEDHPVHWCLLDLEYQPIEHKLLGNQRELKVWTHLTGLEEHVDPVKMTRSWVQPASVHSAQGLRIIDYDRTQRAYVFASVDPNERDFSFTLRSPPAVHQINPVFVIEGIENKATIEMTLNGLPLGVDSFRYGFERHANGLHTLVIWLEQTLQQPANTIALQVAR